MSKGKHEPFLSASDGAVSSEIFSDTPKFNASIIHAITHRTRVRRMVAEKSFIQHVFTMRASHSTEVLSPDQCVLAMPFTILVQ